MATTKRAKKSKSTTAVRPRAAAKGGSARGGAAKPTSLVLSAISPSLTVTDVESSLTWYRDVLGFTVAERWERDGKLLGAGLASGKAFLMLGQDDWKKGTDRIKGQGVRLYCETDQDIDRLAARIKTKGGVLTQGPKNQDWGVRDLAIDDPDGYHLTIAAKLKKKR